MKQEKISKIRKHNYETYSFTIREWMIYIAEGIGAGIFVAWLCYRSVFAAPLAGVIAAGVVWWRKCTLLEKKKGTAALSF